MWYTIYLKWDFVENLLFIISLAAIRQMNREPFTKFIRMVLVIVITSLFPKWEFLHPFHLVHSDNLIPVNECEDNQYLCWCNNQNAKHKIPWHHYYFEVLGWTNIDVEELLLDVSIQYSMFIVHCSCINLGRSICSVYVEDSTLYQTKSNQSRAK